MIANENEPLVFIHGDVIQICIYVAKNASSTQLSQFLSDR